VGGGAWVAQGVGAGVGRHQETCYRGNSRGSTASLSEPRAAAQPPPRASDVRAACLVRWSREPGAPPGAEELQARLRRRYTEALEAYPRPAGTSGEEEAGEEDAASSDTPSTSSSSAGGGTDTGSGDSLPSGRGGSGAAERRERPGSSGSSYGSGGGGGGGGGASSDAWATLHPRGRVADAINHSTVAIQIASAYPSHITQAALERAGIQQRPPASGGGGGGESSSGGGGGESSSGGGGGENSSAGAAGGAVVVRRASVEVAAVEAAAAAAAVGSELHVVVASNGLAERLRALLLGEQQAGLAPLQPAAAVAASAAAVDAAASGSPRIPGNSSGGGGGSGGGVRRLHAHVHVADWCARSASQRAAAGSALLAEHKLAELLGCVDSTLVMDGVAWR
jgi:hypothetical protein